MALSDRDISIIKAMLYRGDAQHHIAAWFGERPETIALIAGGALGASSPLSREFLPPPGPLSEKVQQLLSSVVYALDGLKSKSDGPTVVSDAIQDLEEGLQPFKHDVAVIMALLR